MPYPKKVGAMAYWLLRILRNRGESVRSFNHREVGRDVTVLIVEDEFVSRRALTLLLRASGYRATPVSSGEEALRVARQLPGEVMVALVDVDLPGMDGAEFIRRLERVRPGAQPVLVTAASADRVREAIERGVPHLRKPVDVRELMSVIADRAPTN